MTTTKTFWVGLALFQIAFGSAVFFITRSIYIEDAAPAAIGTYSQAVKCGSTVYLSGQIPLVPETMELVDAGMEAQIRRVFDNLSAVAAAAGGSLGDVAKLNIYLTDLDHFALVNQVMADYFQEPYPAGAAVAPAVPSTSVSGSNVSP